MCYVFEYGIRNYKKLRLKRNGGKKMVRVKKMVEKLEGLVRDDVRIINKMEDEFVKVFVKEGKVWKKYYVKRDESVKDLVEMFN